MRERTRFALALVALTAVALVGALAVSAFGGGDPSEVAARLTGKPGGDRDGKGYARLDLQPNRGRICYRISYRRIAQPVISAHVHEAPKDREGALLIDLFEGRRDRSPIVGCEPGLRRGAVRAIRRAPERFVVELHNTWHPGGALRGRLHRR